MSEAVVLLVEDNVDDAALVMRSFRRHAVSGRVDVARDGADALAYLLGSGADAAPLPDVVLLDLKLPRIDGLEVLRQIRAASRTRLLPVVILTSSKEESDVHAGYALGANSYVRKPVSFEEFAEAMRQVGVYWLQCNRCAASVP